jgi:hypothetical protein
MINTEKRKWKGEYRGILITETGFQAVLVCSSGKD